MTRNERRQRNYALVRNAYGDDDLAKKARDYGTKRLYQELGIKVVGTDIPPLKDIDHSRDKYYKRKLEKFQYAVDIGHSVKNAKKLTNYRNEKIKSSLSLVKITKRPFTYDNRIKRMDLWSTWSGSGKNNMPPDIERWARYYNREAGLDDYDKYGYAFAFYLFVENEDEEAVKKLLSPNKFTGEAMYRATTRIPA